MLTLWLIIINVVLAFGAVSLNSLIILTFIKTSSLREKPSNVLILGLAIADLCVGIIAQPLSYIYDISVLKGYFGLQNSIQIVYFAFSFFLSIVSFLTFTAITVDRFLAIHLHLRYQALVTSKRYGVTLAGIWLLGFSMCCLLFQMKNSMAIVIPILYVILLVNAIFIFEISRVIRRHSVQIHAQQQSVQQVQSINMPRYKKSVNTMYYVAGAFVLCYFPFLAMISIVGIRKSGSLSIIRIWLPIFNTLAKAVSVIDPVIFWWRIKEMRSTVKICIRGTGTNMPNIS
ncbi:melanocortin receptor 5-like [Actinia tenebrosa]|uniref:Melanocortin receptor 5-like n=1 Tax=Actinia tenebrosa TaxID=6105 RepID=A0A6P8HP89_ACTTE|nr:melanocortin receptor 5-like [Actinia tenebrosa]